MVARRLVFALLACLVVALPASANIVVNGSFESPAGQTRCDNWGANGWTPDWGGASYTPEAMYIFPSNYPGPAYDGINHMTMFASAGYYNQSISQTLNTVVGQAYEFSFEVNSFSAQGVSLLVSWLSNGADLLGVFKQTQQAPGWEKLTFSATAQSAQDTIRIKYLNYYPGWWSSASIDDVQVNAVPEPASICALMMGLAGVVGLKRRAR